MAAAHVAGIVERSGTNAVPMAVAPSNGESPRRSRKNPACPVKVASTNSASPIGGAWLKPSSLVKGASSNGVSPGDADVVETSDWLNETVG